MDQLKEVWHEADGLDPEEFNPKTFFTMHGNEFLIVMSALNRNEPLCVNA